MENTSNSISKQKPITAKSLNVILTIVAIFGLIVLVLEILTCYFMQNDTSPDTGGGDAKPSETWLPTLSLLIFFLLIAYFVILIIGFAKSIRFRRTGGGKSITILTTFAFVFGLLQFLVVAIAILIFLVLVWMTFGWIFSQWNSMVSILANVLWVGVAFMSISFAASLAATIVGWTTLRKL